MGTTTPTTPTEAFDERRRQRRYLVTLPVAIEDARAEVEPAERVGLSRDASIAGVLFNTRSRFTPDETLELTLHVSPSDELRVRGRVVRVENVPPGSSFLWRYLTAVSFDAPHPELEPTLVAHARTARRAHPDVA